MAPDADSMPHASSVLSANDDPTLSSDGFTWQEVITRVYGFRISATDRIQSLKNLSAKDASPADALCSSENDFLFLLLDDEIVMRVEAFFTDEAVKAVRFFTSMRISQWFGEPTGHMRRFSAPRGCGINAIQTRYTKDGCTKINVVFLPLTVIEDEYSIRARTSQYVHKSTLVTGVPKRSLPAVRYSTYCEMPRAVVFKTGSSISDVHVLSEKELSRYIDAYRLWKPSESEQVLTLSSNERMEAVGISASSGNVVAICVKTNVQTSQWFGKAVPADATWFDCKLRPGSYICGFELAGRSVTGLGVIYAVPDTSSEVKHLVAVDAKLAKRTRREEQ